MSYPKIHNQDNKDRAIIESFNCAIEGIIETIRQERNMKIHVFVSIFIILVSLFMDLTKLEIALVAFSISLVWITEILNTSVEAIVDMYIKEYHELAKLAKDTAAGAVLVASFNAMLVGYFVYFDRVKKMGDILIKRIKVNNSHLTISILVVVVILVLMLKSHFRRGTPLRGGMPSGHSAIAFAIWVIVCFQTTDLFIIILNFFMALLVSQTRVKAGIHSFKEVFIGAILGASVSFILIYLINKI